MPTEAISPGISPTFSSEISPRVYLGITFDRFFFLRVLKGLIPFLQRFFPEILSAIPLGIITKTPQVISPGILL